MESWNSPDLRLGLGCFHHLEWFGLELKVAHRFREAPGGTRLLEGHSGRWADSIVAGLGFSFRLELAREWGRF